MRAILIDPKLQRVIDVELAGETDAEQLADMRRIIGASNLGHSTLSDVGDTIWCDDTILARGEPCWGFRLGRREHSMILAGNCVVVGADRAGNSRAPRIPIPMIVNDCQWLGEIVPEIFWVEDAQSFGIGPAGQLLAGFRAVVTYSRRK